jgi:two-component system, NtrC family, sensor kinase
MNKDLTLEILSSIVDKYIVYNSTGEVVEKSLDFEQSLVKKLWHKVQQQNLLLEPNAECQSFISLEPELYFNVVSLSDVSAAETNRKILVYSLKNHPQLDSIKQAEQKLKALTNQLLQSEKLASIGQLAAGVAHEINNPVGYVASNMAALAEYANTLIAVIRNLVQSHPTEQNLQMLAAADFEYLTTDVQALVKESEQGIDRIITIVNALKDFSYIEEEDFIEADLHQGIESTLNIANSEIKYRANIVKNYGEIPLVECIPSQINQVLLNLLVNAAQAMSAFGQITITTGTTGYMVWVEVADTGCGIASEILEQIFEPFFTTKPKGTGTGLGLALSLGIIEKHHGYIDISSKVDSGTAVAIYLPIKQPD